MRSDANFDNIGAVFEEEIYGSSKGYIRLHVLWQDLLSEIPSMESGTLSILDAGSGAGHLGIKAGRLGNTVVMCDPSQEMLSKANECIRASNLTEHVTTIHSSVQNLDKSISEKFDVIFCHAVLEWLAEPQEALDYLVKFLKTDGLLSLMFYNRNAALIKAVLRGEFGLALQERKEGYSPRGWGDGATPLGEEAVRKWLDSLGMRVRSKTGIRILHDHLQNVANAQSQLDSLLRIEMELRKQEPFASLGQHIHLVCERAQ